MSSYFRRLFIGTPKGGASSSTSSKAKPDVLTEVERTKQTIETLEKKVVLLEKKISEQLAKARQYSRDGNKARALQCLKQKRLYEGHIQTLHNQQMTLQTQMDQMEMNAVNAQVVDRIKAGNKATKAQTPNIDEVDNVMEDMNEALQVGREISERMAEPVGAMAEFDEDELEAELEQALAEDLEAELLEASVPVPTVPAGRSAASELPDAPTAAPVAKPAQQKGQLAQAEEDELAALQAEMNMVPA